MTTRVDFERHVAGAKHWSERGYKQGRLSLIFPIPLFLLRYLVALPRILSASTMSSRSATPVSTPSLVNHRLSSLLVVLEAPPTADAALDVVEEWAQDLSPLVVSRLFVTCITQLTLCFRTARLSQAAVKQLAERASESWVEWARGDWPELATAIDAEVERRLEEQKRLAEEEARRVEEAAKRAKAAEDRRLEDERRRKDEEDRRKQAEDERRAQEAADEEMARIAAAEGLLDKGKGRARVDEEVAELSDDPSIKTPRAVERPFAMTEVDMAAAALEKRQAGQKVRAVPTGLLLRQGVRPGQDKEDARRGINHEKAFADDLVVRPASPGPSVADSSGSKKRRVDEPPRPLLRLPLDGASRLGLEQDDLDALDLDDESRGIIRVIREERAHIARRRALLHDMDIDLQRMEKAALAKGGIGRNLAGTKRKGK
ncbi:hypothetical protein IEO21_10981 [Rhodonia placenta]|uniref:Uncharacterized protein n=1 Tax=Rhodonia placenta TaxID=104341 RepID=A0A8H7NRF5_9APHY|nr:hypothetical protein IEO21_10981 [Postia placenta]